MQTDNILSKLPWHPPYYLMVLRVSKYDDKNTLPVIRHVGPVPALAYALYLDELNGDRDTIREHVYDYLLQDSFGNDALDFCAQRYYQFIEEDEPEEKEVIE